MPRIEGGKKKFGKNLNKLVKPAAPPIAQSAAGTQRNGLLLLSAQKKSTGGLLSAKPSTAVHHNTNASSASNSGTVTAVVTHTKAYESSTASTHDALLSAVTGKTERDANHAPDAWGVAAAEKQQQSIETKTQVTVAESKKETGGEVAEQASTLVAAVVDNTESNRSTTGPSWDDYGGRGDASSVHSKDDQQVNYMSRLARERSAQARAQEEERMQQQRERASARLRELDEKQQSSRNQLVDTQAVRKPWDRTRSGTRELWEPDQKLHVVRKESPPTLSVPEEQQPLPVLGSIPAPASKPTASIDSQQQPVSCGDGPVIHLSSYEDRDRGERSAAPRMLYDPKSGSMVAVKEQQQRGGGEERKKVRGRTKPRKERGLVSGKPDTRSEQQAGVESASRSTLKNAKPKRQDSGSVADKKEKNRLASGRLPRTCGVLYERDEAGQIRCMDGCDGGDLGYGAHSVPGGRVLNPEAYQEYVTLHRHHHHHLDEVDSADDYVYGDMYGGSKMSRYGLDGGDELALRTGYNPSDPEEEEMEEVEPLEWVKADDKLELVTGMDDSPTLKPTAKEWAPSQAAIAAAAAAAHNRSGFDTGNDMEHGDESAGDEVETDEDDDGSFGLGFDPTLNMHGLMQSPPIPVNDSVRLVAAVDLDSLQLDTPLFSSDSSKADTTGPDHIFAFGSSGTWGSKPGTASSNGDWTVSGGTTGGLFGGVESAFGAGSGKPTGHSNPFSAWGSGLGGLSLNGDNKAAMAD